MVNVFRLTAVKQCNDNFVFLYYTDFTYSIAGDPDAQELLIFQILHT